MKVETSMAELMADLTCDLAKTCSEKENYFASMFNLTPAEFKCLRLFKHENSLPVKDLGTMMDLTPGRITHITTSLEKKNFLTRTSGPKDKRNVIVTITDKSQPFIKNVNDSHVKIHQEILERIDPDKREAVISAMEEVIRALKHWNESSR